MLGCQRGARIKSAIVVQAVYLEATADKAITYGACATSFSQTQAIPVIVNDTVAAPVISPGLQVRPQFIASLSRRTEAFGHSDCWR